MKKLEKEELIKLAKDKGFTSDFLYNKPFKYSNKEKLRWLFWLNELKLWFQENHNIEVEPYRTAECTSGEKYGCQGENWNGETEEEFDLFNIYGKEFVETFELGLQIALETIKK